MLLALPEPPQGRRYDPRMKKTFQLQIEGKNPERVLEAVKHEIRKYIKRERRRDLPEGVDFCDFDCKFGPTAEAAQMAHLSALTGLIDGVAQEGGPQFYVEILAKPGHRQTRPALEDGLENGAGHPANADSDDSSDAQAAGPQTGKGR